MSQCPGRAHLTSIETPEQRSPPRSSQQRPSDSLREREEVHPIRAAVLFRHVARDPEGGTRSGSGKGAIHRNVSEP